MSIMFRYKRVLPLPHDNNSKTLRSLSDFLRFISGFLASARHLEAFILAKICRNFSLEFLVSFNERAHFHFSFFPSSERLQNVLSVSALLVDIIFLRDIE